MAIAVREVVVGSGTAAVTVNTSANVQAGDFIVVLEGLTWKRTTTGAVPAPTATGLTFTRRTPQSDLGGVSGQGNSWAGAFTAPVTSGGAKSISMPNAGFGNHVLVYVLTGVDAADPVVDCPQALVTFSGSQTTSTAPSATAVAAGALICLWGPTYSGGGTAAAAPAGMTPDPVYVTPTADSGKEYSAYLTPTTAGATGTKTITANGAWADTTVATTVSLALRADAGGTPTPDPKSGSDSAAVTEGAASLTQVSTRTETASLSGETASLSGDTSYSRTDSGTLTAEAALLTAQTAFVAVDQVTLNEGSGQVARTSASSDGAALTGEASTLTASAGPTASDGGTLTEGASILVGTSSRTDSAAMVEETIPPTVTLGRTDTATMSGETAVLVGSSSMSRTDSATLSELAQVLADGQIGGNDTGTLTEQSQLTDTGGFSRADGGSLTEARALAALPSRSESAVLLEAASVVVQAIGGDGASLLEVAYIGGDQPRGVVTAGTPTATPGLTAGTPTSLAGVSAGAPTSL